MTNISTTLSSTCFDGNFGFFPEVGKLSFCPTYTPLDCLDLNMMEVVKTYLINQMMLVPRLNDGDNLARATTDDRFFSQPINQIVDRIEPWFRMMNPEPKNFYKSYVRTICDVAMNLWRKKVKALLPPNNYKDCKFYKDCQSDHNLCLKGLWLIDFLSQNMQITRICGKHYNACLSEALKNWKKTKDQYEADVAKLAQYTNHLVETVEAIESYELACMTQTDF